MCLAPCPTGCDLCPQQRVQPLCVWHHVPHAVVTAHSRRGGFPHPATGHSLSITEKVSNLWREQILMFAVFLSYTPFLQPTHRGWIGHEYYASHLENKTKDPPPPPQTNTPMANSLLKQLLSTADHKSHSVWEPTIRATLCGSPQ